jgi:hypothetical protein
MTKNNWFSRLPNEHPVRTKTRRVAGGIGVAVLLLMTGIAAAQGSTPTTADNSNAPLAPTPVVQDGYLIHQSADLGGHYADINGSGAMYDTLVNIQSGPRVLGQTFTMQAVPGSKHGLLDELSAFSTGFGGDPNNFAKLDFSKGKLYEFSGQFRRDRRYFDYDLLGNPGIPRGETIPIGPSTAPTGEYAWPQVTDSPFMFNTVRRMTDTKLTLFPLSKVTIRVAYSQNIFQGPSFTPSGDSVAGTSVILEEIQRNSTDDFTGAVDWKPVQQTKFTFEEQVDHYKGDSYFIMDPAYNRVQESDGTRVALLDIYHSSLPYGYNSTTGAFAASSNCNSTSMINPSTILYANPTGGPPIIDPACNVISSYTRTQPTREIFPTEIFRFQSSSIRNIAMNGNFRYTNANMNLPNFNAQFQGLDGAARSITYAGYANAKRQVVAADYGITWRATRTFSVSDQVSFSHAHQPGTSEFTSAPELSTPTTAGAETINHLPLTPSTASLPEGGAALGVKAYNYFGQKFLTNNATATWDASDRATLSLTYRYQNHVIAEDSGNMSTGTSFEGGLETYTINENGGIFNVALRPTDKWDINGSVEALYNDNVFTPVGARQEQHYRVHTMYRPNSWATLSAAFNDKEQHNNTNNTGTVSLTPTGAPIALDRVAHTRIISLGADLMPNQHYGLDLNYAYNDVYTSTNACAQSAISVLQGGAIYPGIATPTGTLCAAATGPTRPAILAGPFKDFEDAPTQYGSIALALIPTNKIHSALGYRVSSVNGTRAFTDTADVNGSLVSTYQTPFVNIAWTVHPGLIWKGEYDYYGYGEGEGHSGAQWCNVRAVAPGITSVTPVACSTIAGTAMNASTPYYGDTAPRNFHTNVLTLSLHYEF